MCYRTLLSPAERGSPPGHLGASMCDWNTRASSITKSLAAGPQNPLDASKTLSSSGSGNPAAKVASDLGCHFLRLCRSCVTGMPSTNIAGLESSLAFAWRIRSRADVAI